ncbi:MAG: anthranilate synthase component I family protein [Limnohabitans sp.]|nr:anthranilate synthase component I family protein [Limnohabitans sp.]
MRLAHAAAERATPTIAPVIEAFAHHPSSTQTRETPLCAADILLRWPKHLPLAALVSGGGESEQNGWSIFGLPSSVVVIDGGASDADTLRTLESALARTPRHAKQFARGIHRNSHHENTHESSHACPFRGGWIVAFGYELGTAFEPESVCESRDAKVSTPEHARAPRAVLYWCEDAWLFNHATGALESLGTPPALETIARTTPRTTPHTTTSPAWSLEPLRCDIGDSVYAGNVARTVEYIRAGDAFQANIARRFTTRLTGCRRSFARAAIASNGAWFGASIDLPDGGCIISMSPELFLRVQPDGAIVTRPIKGTRPATTDARELLESEKDAAELAMIVDLMRNDLGRVAQIGSVSVESARVLETHSTVHHGVAEIRATLRDDVSWFELLRATFPPGSVTGAPKVRAMQIIDELESATRGFYCGAIGFISHTGHAVLNVAIRTAHLGAPDLEGVSEVRYHAGCGIVVESEPNSEVAETHAKARAIARFVR